ncbi:MAG: hypothetical protein J0M34_00970 [Alphaproteobacteria bacterium]|nr:hypothetical protein [Alphaproteobacteria bacterium]
MTESADDILKRLGFTEKNISSIVGRGKRNSPKTLQLIRETLTARADDLAALMEATGFDAKSLSSMLHGAGAHIATGIEALVANKDKLKGMVDAGTFDAKSLSSMLNGAGAHIAEAIDAIYTRQDKLNAIVRGGFAATEVATRLHAVATSDLGAEIDALYTSLYPELNSNTVIPAGAEAQIVDGSPATLAAQQQVEK